MRDQAALDALGCELLTCFFEKVFSAKVSHANLTAQLKGVDICVSVPGRRRSMGHVGIDVKADNYLSRNITNEIISQDRGNSVRTGPAPGWVSKSMPLVAYLLIQRGELILLNMELFYPWLQQRLTNLANSGGAPDWPSAWPSGTPNDNYSSYNFIIDMQLFLETAPGALYLRLPELMGEDVYASITQAPLQPYLRRTPPVEGSVDTVGEWLLSLPGYHHKTQYSALQMERMLRWFEIHAKFKSDPKVKEKGEANIKSRPRFPLPEDNNPESPAPQKA